MSGDTGEQYKNGLHNPDNHDGVITHLEPDILECEVKWALESITTNNASGGDGIPVELFQILKDDTVKMLQSISQQIWKTQQWPQDWKRSVLAPFLMTFVTSGMSLAGSRHMGVFSRGTTRISGSLSCGARALPQPAPSRARTLEAGKRWARLAQARAASRPGLGAIAPGRSFPGAAREAP